MTRRPDITTISKVSTENVATERSETLTLTSPNSDISSQVTESFSVPPITTTSRSRKPVATDGRHTKPKIRRRSKAVWGRWQPWTECSRSCGGGVMSQSRQCLDR